MEFRFPYGIKPKFFLINTIIGAAIVGFFILLNSFNASISIGIPKPYATAGETILVVVFLAGILETFAFNGVMQGFLSKVYFKDKIFLIIANAIIVSTIFAFFHMRVYGGFEWASASFVGAFTFCMAMSLITEWRKDLWPACVAHMGFNAFLLTQVYFAIAI